jgi:hypothetical protein
MLNPNLPTPSNRREFLKHTAGHEHSSRHRAMVLSAMSSFWLGEISVFQCSLVVDRRFKPVFLQILTAR